MQASRSFSVYVTRPDVPEVALKVLREKCNVEVWSEKKPLPREVLLEKIRGKDGLFCTVTEKIDAELLDAAGENLKVLATWSVGFDHIDVNECKKRNIEVGHTPGVLTDTVAELGIALLLMTGRRLLEASKQITSGGWFDGMYDSFWMCGSGLKNSTVGIVGMGRIGLAVLKRVKNFNTRRIIYYDVIANDEAEALGAEKMNFHDLLKASDYVICCCILTPETKGMFNSEAFSLMKPTSIFVNIGRGGLVDQDALLDALKNGVIKAAGLDVMTPEPLPVDHPLTKLPNCVLVPHVGTATYETRTEMAILTSKNIIAGLEGKQLPAGVKI